MPRTNQQSVSTTISRILYGVVGVGLVLVVSLGYFSMMRIVEQEATMGLTKVVGMRAETVSEFIHHGADALELEQALQFDEGNLFELLVDIDGAVIASKSLDPKQLKTITALATSRKDYPFVVRGPGSDYFFGVTPVANSKWLLVRAYSSSLTIERVSDVFFMPLVMVLLFVAGALYVVQRAVRTLVVEPLAHFDRAIEGVGKGLEANIPIKANNEYGRLARSFEDLSEQLKEREQSLIDARNTWQGTFDSVLEFVTIVDTEFNLVQANRTFLKTYSLTLDEAVGANRIELFSDENRLRFRGIYEQVLRDREVHHASAFSNRSKAYYEMTFVPMLRGDGTVSGVIEVTRDVTEPRGLEEQLRQSQKMEAIGQLAGGVAHDFNNLLQVVLGYAETLESELQQSNGDVESARRIIEAGNKAASLTQKLLAFGRRQVMQAQPIEVDAVVNESLKLLDRLIGADVELISIPQDKPMIIDADSNQIEQVLINLCMNSRDAMPDGGTVRIVVEEVSAEELPNELMEGRYVRISVQDSGTGISDEVLLNVFEPFFTTKETDKGTGLGLATAYGIARQHGGTITAESTLGNGATFSLFLPLSESEDWVIESVTQPIEKDVQGSECVLLADDDDAVRELLAAVLKGSGYQVVEACDGTQAIHTYETSAADIDIVVLDMIMPGLTGSQVLERARALNPHLPCLLASGFSEEKHREAIVTDEQTGFIGKPFRGQELLLEVRRLLDNKSAGKLAQN